jgi:LysR family transcriptional regulator, benzoate and cis,cis-muconate-responsive activator of ben and cat genes
LPFVRHLRSKFQIDVEWVELSIVEQFEAVASRKVDAAFCRLLLSHDGLVQCAVLFEDTRKLVVPADHRLARKSFIDPEELALETLPTLPDDHQLGAWGAFHFPDHTPSGRPIRKGSVVTTVRECLAVVESGKAVVIFGARAERYCSTPASNTSTLVRRRADRRRSMQDLEECSRDITADWSMSRHTSPVDPEQRRRRHPSIPAAVAGHQRSNSPAQQFRLVSEAPISSETRDAVF